MEKIGYECFACGAVISEDEEVCPKCGYSFTAGEDLEDILPLDKIKEKDINKVDKSSFWTQLSEEI